MQDFRTHTDQRFELIGGLSHTPIRFAELRAKVDAMAQTLTERFAPLAIIGLYADNSPDWVIADLAIQQAGMVAVPIPSFFSEIQLQHVLVSHQADGLVTDVQLPTFLNVRIERLEFEEGILDLYRLCHRDPQQKRFKRPGKLTFTSGSTGAPTGIGLASSAQWAVAKSIATMMGAVSPRRHLALLPLPVLLENVAGLYTSMALGATCFLPPLTQVGLTGSSRFDASIALRMIEQTESETLILLPQMLKELVNLLAQRPRTLSCLKFVAVGGAQVAPGLLEEARKQGLPVYEGYGLTEAASVVALNTPGHDRPGSVGRPLPHQLIKISGDGEIAILAAAGLDSDADPEWFFTGDLGRLDADGFLYVNGRLKNLIITSFGRNVSPEWPEAMLQRYPEIAQAMVYGEGQPQLSALVVPGSAGTSRKEIDLIVQRVNQSLPDYARIASWVVASEPFSAANGTLTANGRLKRDVIAARYLNLATISDQCRSNNVHSV